VTENPLPPPEPEGPITPPPAASWYEPYDPPESGSHPDPGAGPPGGGSGSDHPGGPTDGGAGWPGYHFPAGPPQAGRVRRRRRTGPVLAAVLAVGTVAASAGLTHELWPAASVTPAVALQLPPTTQTPATQTPATQTPSGTSGGSGSSGGSANTSSVAAEVSPALVDINTNFQYQSASGAGTGIVLTSTGEILTNNHVINGETSIQVTDIGNGKTYAANVVGYDAANDIAVLQLVGASGLQTANIGNSNNLTVGQSVVAIGNAGGTGGTPTAASGTITALNQAITAGDELNGTSENLSNLIETNADVQSGDSGGSLVNSTGQVIGIDSAASQGMALQSAASSTNQGYAIPINQALSIAKQIEAGQASSTVHVGSTAFLGVLISSGSASPVQGNGFGSFGSSGSGGSGGGSGSGSTSSGATISGVVPGGSAATAGLAAGDVITSVDGQAVTSPVTLTQIMAQQHPGQSIQVGWTDQSGATHTTTVNLQSGPPA
jgi:S1-C subfamily serine protease